MKMGTKGLALLLVGMMLMSGLAVLSTPVIANENLTGTAGIQAVYNDNWMIDHPGIAAADEAIVVNYDSSAGSLYYLGDEEVSCDITFLNGGTDTDADTAVTFTISSGTGNTLVVPGDVSTHTVAAAGPGISSWPAGTTINAQFTIDIGNVGDVETIYPMRVAVQYTMAAATETNTLQFDLYVSSLWHPDTSNALRDAEYMLPNVIDDSPGTPDAPFEAGDEFKAAQLVLHNHAAFGVEELNGTLTSNNNMITLYNTVARTPAGVAADTNAEFNYRVDVAPNTPPGFENYDADFVCDYLRTVAGVEKYCTENVRMTHFAVDFSFADDDPYTPVHSGETLWSEFQCFASEVTILNDTRQIDYVAPYTIPSIEQSTYTDEPLRLEVTIVNNGNTPLYNVEFQIDPTGWDFFRNPRFFWEDINAGTPEYDTITDTYSVFDMGAANAITFQIEMFVAADIPIGEHRLPITYNGFYFDDGSLGSATGYIQTNGGNDLEVVFSIAVEDNVIACHVAGAVVAGGAGDKVDITGETMTVTIVNDEQYAFIDIIVRANFNNTPWYMPVINMASPWVDANQANPATPMAAWAAGGNLVVTFTVDTDPNMTPDIYPFQIEITAVIEETLEVVTVVIDYRQGCVLDYAGYGPDIYVTAFTADDIVPGKAFNLALTLENVGDDTLRDVTVAIQTDGTDEYAWDLEQEFKEQFDWSAVYENWMDVSGPIEIPDDMFYTVEDLDVDNIREIVEINLYMDGVYSDPSARIALIHIIDLAPGAQFEVTFEMYTDKDMVNGKPYDFPVQINGIDSNGNAIVNNRMITVMSSLPGESYNPVELNWFDAGLKALALFLFFIIVLAILLFVYNMFKGEPYDDDEDFDFEDNEPFEPEPIPEPMPAPEAEPELVEP